MRKSYNNKAFTVIEAAIYISLASIMLLAIASFAKIILEARTRNKVINEVEQQGAQVARTISQTIRNAEAISSPAAGGSSDSLILDVVQVLRDPTIFSANGSEIAIQEGSGSQINLTNSHVFVQNLIFENLSRTDTPELLDLVFF